MKQIYILLTALAITVACKKAAPPADTVQSKLHTGLKNFFTAESDVTRRAVGLWVADKASLERIAEKRGLLSGLSGSDPAAVRQRLENMDMFFHIGTNGSYRSMTLVRGSVGLSYGRLASRQLGDREQIYDATIKGKTETRATIRVLGSPGAEKFIYQEGGDTIEAFREKRNTAELVATYEPRITASASLPPG